MSETKGMRIPPDMFTHVNVTRVSGIGHFTIASLRQFVDDVLGYGFHEDTPVFFKYSTATFGQDSLTVSTAGMELLVDDEEPDEDED